MSIRQQASRHGPWWLIGGGAFVLIAAWLLGPHLPAQALSSYLFAFVFYTGLSAGSLALMMIHALTGGAWGLQARPQLLAAASALPLQAALAVPLLLGLGLLYPWARPEVLAHDALLRAQAWYLNRGFFTGRTVGYFVLWLLLLALLRRHLPDAARLRRIAAAGLILYALSASLAAVDWIMSLLPHWHSTVFGLMLAADWLLAAGALAALHAAAVMPAGASMPRVLSDLGNLLLALVLACAYLAFMQYLTIWSADLPGETVWYIPRALGGWRDTAWALALCQFVIPLIVLLSREAKRRRAWLGSVASLLLAAGLADAWWLIAPNTRVRGFALYWSDLGAPLGMGALWAGVFLRHLPTGPSAARADAEATSHGERAHG
jgi:hypothetical protein